MTSPVKNHNKGPIGPLDPDEPPPYDPEMRREEFIDVHYAIATLRSMGCDIDKADFDYWEVTGTGPLSTATLANKRYEWGSLLNFLKDATRRPVLTRKEATELIRNLGYPITDTTLQQNRYGAGPKLPFKHGVAGRAYYAEEACRKWVPTPHGDI